MVIESSDFGTLSTGEAVLRYTLTNGNGIKVDVITYGAVCLARCCSKPQIVSSICVPDKTGTKHDIALGFDSVADYEKRNSPYFGCVAGRVANRIAKGMVVHVIFCFSFHCFGNWKGKFSLEGKEYTLATNNGENALHGGLKGFDKV